MTISTSTAEYAQKLVSKGYGYQNAARIAGMPEAALRALYGAAKPRSSPAPWRAAAARPRTPERAQPASVPCGPSMQIIREVATKYGLTAADILGPRRTREIVYPRQEAMYRIRKERHRLSLPMIGRILGGRDHTTILHGVRAHEARMAWAEVLIALGTDVYQPDLFAMAA